MHFQFTDPESGLTATMEGDSPPTEQELEQIFSAARKPKADIFRGPTEFEQGLPSQLEQAGGSFAPEIPSTDLSGFTSFKPEIPKETPPITLAGMRQAMGQPFGGGTTEQMQPYEGTTLEESFGALTKPFVRLPEFTAESMRKGRQGLGGAFGGGTAEQMAGLNQDAGYAAAAALLNNVKGVVEFAESPLGIATAGAGAGGEAIRKLIGLGFSADIASKIPDAVNAAADAKTPEEKGTAYVNLAVTLGMPVALALPAMKSTFEGTKPPIAGEQTYATQERVKPESNIGEYQRASEVGAPAETGGGNRPVGSPPSEALPPQQPQEVAALSPEQPIPESQFKPLPRGSLVTIQRADGTTYRAGLDTKKWPDDMVPPNVPSGDVIHRATPEGDWSTGFLKPGEKIVETPKPEAAPVVPEKPAESPQPEIVGMGGATPSELTPTPQTPTGIKNATVDIERAKRGLPPAVEPARRTFGRVWDEAMAKIDNDPGYPDRLIGELRDKPRALTDSEDATILHRQIDLQNEYGKATRDLAQAYDDGRMDDVATQQARVAGLSDQLLDLYDIGKKVGTETGRGLAARKMMAYEDFTLSKMELEKRVANEGRPLTEEQRQQVVKQNEQIQKTQKAYDDYVENTDKKLADQQASSAINEIISTTRKPTAVKKPRTPEEITDAEAKTKENIRLRLSEGKRSEISGMVQKLARLFVERGVREREPLIDSVHGVLKEIDPKFTRRETMDAISGYGDFRQLTKDEISLKLRDLKGQMQQVAKLEDMQAGKPPLKTGLERRIPSPEESRLIKLVNQAKNEFQIPISDEATQLKSSLDTLKTRLKNRTVELQGMLDRKEFATKPKRIIQRDAEANRLHFEMTKAKKAWYEALMKDRMANRSVPQKIFGTGAEILNTSRAILTSMDLSAVLRQGGFIAFGHPIRALKSFPAMFRAFASEKGQHAVDLEIANRPNFPLYNQSKLYLSEHGQTLAKMEEAYMSRWADKIPLVAGSQRAYVTFLNKLRADSFDAMANSLARSKELTPAEARAIANFVNVSTGRGNFGMKENALVGLNTAFFAPRYVASRFQLLAGQPLYRGTARTRMAVAKEYGRFLGGLALVYALANMDGATVDTDPRSSDFGKLRYGDTRIDPMAGLLQSTVLLSRLGIGETKTAAGKVVPIRGEKVPYGGSTSSEVVGRFLRSKLSPALGTGLNILSGKDVVGQPVTAESTAKSLLIPLSLQDIYSTMQEQGLPRGSIMGILSIFGMGLQNYQNKPNKNQTPVRRALVQQ